MNIISFRISRYPGSYNIIICVCHFNKSIINLSPAYLVSFCFIKDSKSFFVRLTRTYYLQCFTRLLSLTRIQSSISRLHSERDKAIAELDKAREELERTQATLGKAQLQQDKLQASLDNAHSEIDKLQEKLDKAAVENRKVSSWNLGKYELMLNVSISEARWSDDRSLAAVGCEKPRTG